MQKAKCKQKIARGRTLMLREAQNGWVSRMCTRWHALARAGHELLRVQVEAQVDEHQADSRRPVRQAKPGRRPQIGEVEIAGQRKDVAGIEEADPLERTEQIERAARCSTPRRCCRQSGNPSWRSSPHCRGDRARTRGPRYRRRRKKRSLAGRPYRPAVGKPESSRH